MTDAALIERVSRAMWEAKELAKLDFGGTTLYTWDEASERERVAYHAAARVAYRLICRAKRNRRRASRIGRRA